MLLRAIAAASLILVSGPAFSSLINDEYTANVYFEDAVFESNADTALLGADAFGNWFGGAVEYDVESESVTIRSMLASSPTTVSSWGNMDFEFLDLDWVDFPTGEIVDAFVSDSGGLGWSSIDNLDLTFTADSLFIEASAINGVEVSLDQFVTISFEVRHGIPEPTTLSLVALTVAGLAWSRKKRTS